ncbi:hypothetical protein YC2023_040889 [Brassica napus]
MVKMERCHGSMQVRPSGGATPRIGGAAALHEFFKSMVGVRTGLGVCVGLGIGVGLLSGAYISINIQKLQKKAHLIKTERDKARCCLYNKMKKLAKMCFGYSDAEGMLDLTEPNKGIGCYLEFKHMFKGLNKHELATQNSPSLFADLDIKSPNRREWCCKRIQLWGCGSGCVRPQRNWSE